MRKTYFILLVLTIISCKKEVVKESIKTENKQPKDLKITINLLNQEKVNLIKKGKSNDSILSNNVDFINDTILKGKFKLNISKYEINNDKKKCFPIKLEKKEIKEFYNEGLENLGDLNNDKKDDFVFVLYSLNFCEEGDSYYFTDNNIPRIQTESKCCHPKSIFSIGDIDEDGGNEIAEYNSSCSSSFKVINIWTLKNGKWKLIEQIDYKINDEYKIFEDFPKLYKKISKGKFKFLEISDIDSNGKLLKEWKTIIMK
jgi:hypothetical protein